MIVRKGYRERNIGITSGGSNGLGVRTLIPYGSVDSDPAASRLFAVTNEGIYDISGADTPAVSKVAFTITTGEAGWGSYIHYTTDAGVTVIIYADEANGLFQYDPGADTWAVKSDITGVDNTTLVHVVSHKLRIWFTERDSTTGWYLDIGAIAGVAVPFYFGGKFPHGGQLVGLYNWTQDTGLGVDDFLVAIGERGDVVPYQGDDPSSANTWSAVGTFYIGEVPPGRRVASEYGANLFMVSAFGLTSLQDMLQGTHGEHPQQSEVVRKIARIIRLDLVDSAKSYGWEITYEPSNGLMLVNSPVRSDGTHIQYRVNIATSAWSFWRGVPSNTFVQHDGATIFGTADNRVMRMDVDLDDVTFADPTGRAIEWSMLCNYLDMGSPGRYKWGEFIRPNWTSVRAPAYETRFLYDFLVAELPIPGAGPVTGTSGVWDVSQWDAAVWATSIRQPQYKLGGSWGPGRTMAVAIRGSSTAVATLVSFDVMWRPGGPF
jgi:hypothetical protein